jgi:hypothetical protein
LEAYLLLHEQVRAVAIIHNALQQNPKWAENLPFVYLLKNEPDMSWLIDEALHLRQRIPRPR